MDFILAGSYVNCKVLYFQSLFFMICWEIPRVIFNIMLIYSHFKAINFWELLDALCMRRPHHSGLWKYELFSGLLWVSENVQPTVLHWLFHGDLHGDPIHTSLDKYLAKYLKKLLCSPSELSFSLCGVSSSKKLWLINSFLTPQTSTFWSQSSKCS